MGTGAVAQLLTKKVGLHGRMIALDLNGAMLEEARLLQGGGPVGLRHPGDALG